MTLLFWSQKKRVCNYILESAKPVYETSTDVDLTGILRCSSLQCSCVSQEGLNHSLRVKGEFPAFSFPDFQQVHQLSIHNREKTVLMAPYLTLFLVIIIIVLFYTILYKCCEKRENETEECSERQNVFIIPMPDLPTHEPVLQTHEPLPTYEELKPSPQFEEMLESPPSYWSLFPYRIYYDKPVITETL